MKPYENCSLTSIEGEIWKSIERYNGNYLISSFGRIKIPKRANKCKWGNEERIKKPSLDQHGYVHTILSIGKKQKIEKHHRLVAEAFIPNPENKPLINHKNSIRWDNRIENLEWCTCQENILHGRRSSNYKKRFGEEISMAKLTNEQAKYIFLIKKPAKELALKYNVSLSCIYGIRHGRYYSNVTGKKLKCS